MHSQVIMVHQGLLFPNQSKAEPLSKPHHSSCAFVLMIFFCVSLKVKLNDSQRRKKRFMFIVQGVRSCTSLEEKEEELYLGCRK